MCCYCSVPEPGLWATSNYTDSAGTQVLAHAGDVVAAINAVTTADLVKHFLPIVSASNMASAKRDLPIYHLLRSDSALMQLRVERNVRFWRSIRSRDLVPPDSYREVDTQDIINYE